MTDATLRQALAYAERGWPVFPCQANRKIPATTHGYQDATTDEQQITDWFTRRPSCNLAIATGAPGPDVRRWTSSDRLSPVLMYDNRSSTCIAELTTLTIDASSALAPR